ncbi:hypothetical protein F4775DRAFT_588663 [Biscogniauxia sp. FL1348]|nr:hypothetical protein F4775DRAFT_588663 [Biscogniauxia sp. FL1348]
MLEKNHLACDPRAVHDHEQQRQSQQQQQCGRFGSPGGLSLLRMLLLAAIGLSLFALLALHRNWVLALKAQSLGRVPLSAISSLSGHR